MPSALAKTVFHDWLTHGLFDYAVSNPAAAAGAGEFMKLWPFFVLGLTLCAVACSREEQAVPEVADEAPITAPVNPSPPTPKKVWESEAFLEHMHRHAQQLDMLNLSLAEGDFDAAMKFANWLSSHEQVEGLPEEWQPYLDGMRRAASDVAAADNPDTARAAAERITVECQGCHAASNVDPEAKS